MPKAIEDLRRTILREARPILLEQGYEQLTVRSVARVCDVAVGTIYRYFDSKDDLVAEIVAADWKLAMKRMQQHTDSICSPIEGLRVITACIRDFISVYALAWMQYRMIYRVSTTLTKRHEQLVQSICSIVHPMMLRFDPQYDPVLSDFLSRTILAAAAESSQTFDELLPVLKRLCE